MANTEKKETKTVVKKDVKPIQENVCNCSKNEFDYTLLNQINENLIKLLELNGVGKPQETLSWEDLTPKKQTLSDLSIFELKGCLDVLNHNITVNNYPGGDTNLVVSSRQNVMKIVTEINKRINLILND